MRKLDQTWSVRGVGGYKGSGGLTRILHTYLEGVIPFMYWGYGLQGCSIARRPCPQRRPVVCMGFGSCTL